MKLNLRRDVIRGVRDHWNRQYENYAPSHRFKADGPSIAEIRDGLAALDLETCSAADIDRVMGVTGWASNACDECGDDFDVLVHFGAEPDYDATWQDLCAGCLQKGLALIPSPPQDRRQDHE